MKKLLVIGGLLVFLASCYNDKGDKLYPPPAINPCDTANRTVSYANDVRPILQGNCTTSGCHDAGAASAGYDFTIYEGAKLAVTNNKLVTAIAHLPGASPMPQGGNKLPDCAIAQVAKWANQGAPNN
jgi:hypothetical protein